MRYKKYKVKMSWEEYEQLPFDAGWKQEYWDGYLRLSPRHVTAVGKCRITEREVSETVPMREVTPADYDQLLAAYVKAFQPTIHFLYMRHGDIVRQAREDLDNFFSGKRGAPLFACSRVAVARQRIVGAALINEGHVESPLLFLLFVAPHYQRRGIGKTLLQAAMNALHAEGHRVLRSQYHLGNHESRVWHNQMGFVEEPEPRVYRLLFQEAESELQWRKRQGNLTKAERQKLTQRRDDLKAKHEAMITQFGWDYFGWRQGIK